MVAAWVPVDVDTYANDEAGPAAVGMVGLVALLDRHRPAWQADAACLEHPDVTFFPERGESLAPARAVCAGCLVSGECAAYAVAIGASAGVWAGVAVASRRRSAA